MTQGKNISSDIIQIDGGKTYYFKCFSSNVNQAVTFQINCKNIPTTAVTSTNTTTTVDVPIGKKRALVCAISDYTTISDLSFCDEDAVQWCTYLSQKGYDIILLGDMTSTYGSFQKTDLATESNIRKWMSQLAQDSVKDDQFVFITSGHGSGDGKGNSFICCLDCSNEPNGQYMDKEIKQDLKQFIDKGVNVIATFDNCYSGGILDDLGSLSDTYICATTTCSNNGYGYDVSQFSQGAWTYYFLIKTLLDGSSNLKNINDSFYKALKMYPYNGGDTPQIVGNGKLMF